MVEQKRDEAVHRFLVEAGIILDSSLDCTTTLQRVAHLIVSELADCCVIDILEKDGSIRQIAATTSDITKQALLLEMKDRYGPTLEPDQFVAEVLRTGASRLYPELPAGNDKSQKLLRKLDRTSTMIVPLVARGQVLGALTLISVASGHRYTADDLAMVEELGRRAGLVVDNARLYDELQEQRVRLQVILASIGDAIITTDTEGRITFMNGVAETLTGWTVDDTTETHLHDVFHVINETTREPIEDPSPKSYAKTPSLDWEAILF